MVFAIIIVIYALIIIGVTIISSRKQAKNDIGSFIANKGQIGILQAVALVVGANIAGSGTVGCVQTGYTTGIAALFGQAVGAIAILLAVLFGLTKFYRVMALDGALSIPEALGKFFSARVRSVIAIICACSYIGLFAIQPSAIAAILAPAFNLDYKTVMWVGGLLCAFVGCMGGIKSISDTNILHTCVMFFSLSIASVLVIKYIGGGFSNVNSSVPSSFLDPFALGWGTTGAYLVTTFGIALNPLSISPVFGCKSLKSANRGLLISAVLLVEFTLAIAYIGISGKAANIDASGADIIYVITDRVSPYLSAIVNVGILAAILSTAPMLLVSASATISHDIYASLINKSATQKQQLVVAKISIFLIAVFGIFIGTTIPSIMSGLMAAIQMVSIPSVIVFISVLSGRIDERAVFWGILSSGLVAVVWYFLRNPFGLQPVWPSLAAGVVVVVPLVILSKGKEYDKFKEYKKRAEYCQENKML